MAWAVSRGFQPRESPGHGAAWGRDCSFPQQCKSLITQSLLIKPEYFPSLLHIYVGAWQNLVLRAQSGGQPRSSDRELDVLCSSGAEGPSLSPGAFRTTLRHVTSRVEIRAVVPVALISGPFGLNLNSNLCVEELSHALWFMATDQSDN